MGRILIGAKLRERRKSLGVTQAALAARIGISASYLNLIEADRRNIGGALLKQLAEALEAPLEDFGGATQRRLVQALGEVASEPLLAPLKLDAEAAGELVSRHPQWARALVDLHRAYGDRSAAATALADRLNHDPFVAETVHSMLTTVSAIRSAAEILESEAGLAGGQRRRFVSIVADDSRKLSEVSRALVGFFTAAQGATRSLTPAEEVDDFFAAADHHFAALEEPGPGDAVAAVLAGASLSPAAGELARSALDAYAAAARLMPYESFLASARALRYDLDALARRFDASFEQVCQRLVTLRRPGAAGVRFGLVRCDAAGRIGKRFNLPRLPLLAHGPGCPLWALFGALQAPGTTLRQLAQFPGGERTLMVARAVDLAPAAFGQPRHLASIMLMCDAQDARQLVYGDGLDLAPAAPTVPVGQGCRVCARPGCAQRQEDPILAPAPAGQARETTRPVRPSSH